MSSDFTHCLGEKLPLELLATDDEVVSGSIIELEVQMDEKCFSGSHEEASEEGVLFEEVREDETPSLLHSEDPLPIRSKAPVVEEKIMLLTPHELESMKVSALESDSEKESLTLKAEPTRPLLTVMYDNKALYVCPVEGCSKGYPNLCMVNNHMVSHDDVKQLKNVRQFKCDAEGCNWSFFSEYKLKRHKESHQGKKDFACTLCRRRFTTLYNLNSHKKLHARPNKFSCSLENCGSEFQTQRELDNHFKEQHQGVEAPYGCPNSNCSKRFHSQNALTTHLRSHSRVGPLLCQWEGCTRSFDRPSHLESHMRTHTGDRPFVCHYEGCGWAFRTPSKLSRHQRTHKNERPFKCPHQGCYKAYLRSEHLKQHLLSQHRGMKMFRCPVENCGAEFTARSTLYVHAKRHNVDAANVTFPCEYPDCNKQYSGKSNLRKHMVRCHGKPIKSKTSYPVQPLPPPPPAELVKPIPADPLEQVDRGEEAQENDYIALLLGDDDPHSSTDRSIVTFLAVPTETLQDMASGSSGDGSNVCVLLHTANATQETSPNPSGQAHIVWSWQAGTTSSSSTTSTSRTAAEECSEFTQSTINMRDLE